MKREIDLLKSIADGLNKINDDLIFSGTFALTLQGMSLRRPVGDIDVLCLSGNFSPLKGMEKTDTYDHIGDYYDEDDELVIQSLPFLITEYVLEQDVKIDVFTPNFPLVYHDHQLVKHKYPEITLLSVSEIVKFKIEHAFGRACSRLKHRDDIIALMINNIK